MRCHQLPSLPWYLLPVLFYKSFTNRSVGRDSIAECCVPSGICSVPTFEQLSGSNGILVQGSMVLGCSIDTRSIVPLAQSPPDFDYPNDSGLTLDLIRRLSKGECTSM